MFFFCTKPSRGIATYKMHIILKGTVHPEMKIQSLSTRPMMTMNVGGSFVVHKSFLELRSKTVLNS